MYTNGALDPWKTLSVASIEHGAPRRRATNTIPSLNGAPARGTYYGAVYPETVHAADLFASSNEHIRQQALKTGMAMFAAALDRWMPHVKPNNRPVLAPASDHVAGTVGTAHDLLSSDLQPSELTSVWEQAALLASVFRYTLASIF
jgi:hypothetical protein